jgi:hypothetical protein
LLLIAADRVDTLESTLGSFASRHPDNLLAETGVRSELSRHGLRSRLGRGRTDVVHQVLDPVVVAGPWVAGVVGVTAGIRRLRRSRR